MRNFAKKHENIIISLLVVLAVIIVVGVNFDYYYQANDDITIKNILSGVYTGTPESRNIQMHYPMSLFISMLYRIGRNVPWYGLFLCTAHFFAFGYIIINSIKSIKPEWLKIVISVIEGFLFAGTMMYELVFVQYTVTCGLLAACGMFGFMMTDRTLKKKEFIKANIPNVVIIVIAFLVRSEMLLLMFPFICIAGLIKWSNVDKDLKERMFSKDNVVKYLSVFAIILLGLGVGQLVHSIAYSGTEWKTFCRFFDDRTELYDYQFVPSYEGNSDFYESIGLKREEQKLLENYNFGIDSDITSDTLKETATYALGLKGENTSLVTRMKNAIPDYIYIVKYGQGTDSFGKNWAELIIAAYILLLLLYFKNRDYGHIWQPLLVAFVRSGLWIYMISTGRYPTRITHPLYFMELVLLIALFFTQITKETQNKIPSVSILSGMVFGALALGIFASNMQAVRAECVVRDKSNKEFEMIKEYTKEHPQNFYFVDVYSMCSSIEDGTEYSEKAFKNVDNSIANYDMLGGWIMNSPHTQKKLDAFGFENSELGRIEKGIVDNDRCYVIVRKDRDVEWLTEYYKSKRNVDVVVEETDNFGDLFFVYSVNK